MLSVIDFVPERSEAATKMKKPFTSTITCTTTSTSTVDVYTKKDRQCYADASWASGYEHETWA
ncbi:MAG TPA: hypothetical protein VGQ81_04485 [Acidobacteriota bacterium]|nr:hypothetical protein [Acidobacteriota bacterium]